MSITLPNFVFCNRKATLVCHLVTMTKQEHIHFHPQNWHPCFKMHLSFLFKWTITLHCSIGRCCKHTTYSLLRLSTVLIVSPFERTDAWSWIDSHSWTQHCRSRSASHRDNARRVNGKPPYLDFCKSNCTLSHLTERATAVSSRIKAVKTVI